MHTPPLGCSKQDIDTPALCLDLDAFEANIREAAASCREHGVAWRPHAKCHKSPDIAQRLVAAGAIGMTCAKLGEAEVFAAAGVRDLLIANLVVGPQKVRRLVELRRHADPIVCLDHIEQAEPISQAMVEAGLKVRAIIEIDIGLQRVGVAPGEPTLELARKVKVLPGIELAGIMGYEGHLLLIQDPAEKEAKIRAGLGILAQMQAALQSEGIACGIVSCGGTGSFALCVSQPGITEIQSGGAIFMDAFYRHKCNVTQFQYALTVLTTVVSRPAPERAIIDAGRKTMNMEVQMPLIQGHDDIHIVSLSAEHGTLQLDETARGLKIGDRLEVIPGYGDLTTVLHDRFFAFRRDRLEAIWPLTARGRLQ
jgi:D-serine deaminase-like pyridoxal phosphate-dependent protein